jgi:virginiamycin B lyase
MFLCMLPRVAIMVTLLAMSAQAQEQVEVFDLPEGAGPHDVSPAPDGTVWYTAQAQGALGVLDPASGAVRQVSLGEGSAPHG